MAQAIARALITGGGRREADAFHGTIDGEPAAVAWADGHLLELADFAAYNPAWAEWRLADLPLCPPGYNFLLEPRESGLLGSLGRLLRGATRVVNACDAAREGELIFDEIARWTGLYGRAVRLQRLWISDPTAAGLRRAWGRLRTYDERALRILRQQGRTRAESDFLWGMNLTRYATLSLKGELGLASRCISIGRVRTPVTGLIADRCREVYTHVREPFYQVHLTFVNERDEPCVAKLLAPPEHKFGERDTDWRDRAVLGERLTFIHLNTAVRWQVLEGQAKRVREYPPDLFDLTDLQRTANRLLGWPARHTSRVAQSLYARHGVISYPRTDCARLPREMQAEVVALWEGLWREWMPKRFPAAVSELPPYAMRQEANFVDQITDHYAIIPTGLEPPPYANADGSMTDEYALWELVVQRFLTAFLPPADILATSRAFVLDYQPGEQLRALVKAAPVLAPGFLVYEHLTATTRGLGERPLPERLKDLVLPAMGPTAALGAAKLKIGHTYPPEFFTYDLLLDKMERLHLGTPATRAETIADLIELGYIAENSSRALVVTEEGEKVVTLLRLHGGEQALDPKLTAFWEAELERVGKPGRGRPREQVLSDLLEQIKELGTRLTAPGLVEEVVFCPKTGLRVAEEEGGWRFPGWFEVLCPRSKLGRAMRASEYRDIFMSGKAGGGPYQGFVSKRTGQPFPAWLVYNPATKSFDFAFKSRRR